MKAFTVRDATAADLAVLAEWRGRPMALPRQPHEHLLVACGGEDGTEPRAGLRLVPRIGLAQPRVWYHVGCVVHAAPELGLFHRQRTLLMGHDHTGASELTDIAHARDDVPLAEQAMALQALLREAILRLRADGDAQGENLIVQLPGLRDAAGQSPFWQGLGRHFYSGDLAADAARHGPAWPGHVAALLPRHLIYTSFLPPAAEAAIAQVAPEARVLCELLQAAGLRYSHHVGVEDAGPVLEAETATLQAI